MECDVPQVLKSALYPSLVSLHLYPSLSLSVLVSLSLFPPSLFLLLNLNLPLPPLPLSSAPPLGKIDAVQVGLKHELNSLNSFILKP